MIKLYDNGVYLLNGTEIMEDTGNVQVPLSKEEAAQNTMAYNILKDHNTSSDMKNLQIRFDKLTSHDITFVGIIQTARASEVPDAVCADELPQQPLCSGRYDQ